MSNMREISVEECNAVFGGEADEIVVTGLRLIADDGRSWSLSYGFSGISYGGYGGGYGGGGGGVGSGELPFPEGWDTGPFLGSLVDTDGNGTLDSVEIVVNAFEPTTPLNYVDIGGGFWGLVGGLTFSLDSVPGIYVGVGAPGAHVGIGVSPSGEIPEGWDSDTMNIILRSGSIPIAGTEPAAPMPDREGHYYVDGWGPFGGAYYPNPGYGAPTVQPAY